MPLFAVRDDGDAADHHPGCVERGQRALQRGECVFDPRSVTCATRCQYQPTSPAPWIRTNVLMSTLRDRALLARAPLDHPTRSGAGAAAPTRPRALPRCYPIFASTNPILGVLLSYRHPLRNALSRCLHRRSTCLSDIRSRNALSRITWSPLLSLVNRGDWHASDHPVLLWRWPAIRQASARTSR